MFPIVALTCLLMGTLSPADAAFGNDTKDPNCTELLPSELNDSWLCVAGFNTTKAWKCIRPHNPRHNLSNNSDQTLLIRVECVRLQKPFDCVKDPSKHPTQQTKQKDDFWMKLGVSAEQAEIFLYGAAAGSCLLVFIVMILLIIRRQKRKRRTETLNDCSVVDSENGITENSLSVNQEVVSQPLCEDDVDDSDFSDDFDDVVPAEPDEDQEDYLTPVDFQAETQTILDHDVAVDQNGGQQPVYACANVEVGAKKQTSEDSATPYENGSVQNNSGKRRYQDLQKPTGQGYPIYENCDKDKGGYMNLMKNNESDGPSDSETAMPTATAPSAKTGSMARPLSVIYCNVPRSREVAKPQRQPKPKPKPKHKTPYKLSKTQGL